MAAGLLLAGLAASCQTGGRSTATDADGARALSSRLTGLVARCWYGSDAAGAFAGTVYAPEVNLGQPRILIVDEDDPTGRPVLVIEPKGRATADVYGPLAAGPGGQSIRADIARWTTGSEDCTA
jgi:hypothetical protein